MAAVGQGCHRRHRASPGYVSLAVFAACPACSAELIVFEWCLRVTNSTHPSLMSARPQLEDGCVGRFCRATCPTTLVNGDNGVLISTFGYVTFGANASRVRPSRPAPGGLLVTFEHPAI